MDHTLASGAQSHYLGAMALISPSSYWRKVNPVGAVADFREVYKQAGRNRWRFAAAAAAMTFAVFMVMWQEEVRGPPAGPTVTIIKSWRTDRSIEQIRRTNLENQREQDRLAAEQAKREEDVRNIYKTLGRVSGMDVASIEKEAAEDRAKEDAAAKAAQSKLTILPKQTDE